MKSQLKPKKEKFSPSRDLNNGLPELKASVLPMSYPDHCMIASISSFNADVIYKFV